MTHNMYIIAGCNGAGKTTASFTILPEILKCHNFVNADEIAKGLSPFDPSKVSIQAGRLMLKRIEELINDEQDFAIETTLSTRSYVRLIDRVHAHGYKVTLLFFWLGNVELAKLRVAQRVQNGGHNIPVDVIERRYFLGQKNFMELFLPICDRVWVIDNARDPGVIIAQKLEGEQVIRVKSLEKWSRLSQGRTSRLKEKLIQGLNLTYWRLVMQKKKEDDELIYSEKGKILTIKARDVAIDEKEKKKA